MHACASIRELEGVEEERQGREQGGAWVRPAAGGRFPLSFSFDIYVSVCMCERM